MQLAELEDGFTLAVQTIDQMAKQNKISVAQANSIRQALPAVDAAFAAAEQDVENPDPSVVNRVLADAQAAFNKFQETRTRVLAVNHPTTLSSQ